MTDLSQKLAVPPGWSTSHLGGLADVRLSSVDKKSRAGEHRVQLCNYLDVYQNDYLRAGDSYMDATATRSEIDRFRLVPGDVIITKDSETPDDIGIVAVVDSVRGIVVCGYHLALIRPANSVNSLFLAKQLGHDRAQAYFGKIARGTTRYGLPAAEIETLPLLVPPLQEQETVSKVLRVLDEAISATEKVIAKLKLVKQGLLRDLLTRGIDESGELRPSPDDAPHLYKGSHVGRIPACWSSPSIDDLAVYVGSGVTPRGGSEVYLDSGVLFVRSQNVHFDGLHLDDVAYIDARTHARMSRSAVFAHDVLLNITGASIGRCCPFPAGLGPANVNQHVCVIRLDAANLSDATFLGAFLTSPFGQNQVNVLNAGSNREGLNYQHVRAFRLVWPNRQERKRIASCLRAFHRRERSEEQQLAKLQSFKRGLMDDLFTGRVRVPALARASA